MPLELDPKTTALLVMDYQAGIVGMVPGDKNALLGRASTLVDAARKASMRVLYVVVSFRPGYPEASARNVGLSPIRSTGRFVAGNPDTAIHDAVAPREDEVVVTKHRVSAFAGTDLDMILRANDVSTLVLAGISTSGVVLSTTRHAYDADYRVVIARDACADPDEEVHRVLMDKVLARQASVVAAEDVTKALAR